MLCWELENVTLNGVPCMDRLTDDEKDALIDAVNATDDSGEWTDDYEDVDEEAESHHSFWSRL